jgi:hypothetical protein
MNLENTPIASAKLAIHKRIKRPGRYARKGGRAIWLPSRFGKQLNQNAFVSKSGALIPM